MNLGIKVLSLALAACVYGSVEQTARLENGTVVTRVIREYHEVGGRHEMYEQYSFNLGDRHYECNWRNDRFFTAYVDYETPSDADSRNVESTCRDYRAQTDQALDG